MKDKITATKLQQADTVADPKNEQYELLIEETRKDDMGVSYKYTRKEITSKGIIEQEIARINKQITSLQEQLVKLTDKETKLV